MDILKRINELREEKGLSVCELTKQAELSENTIYSWYSRGSAPKISNLEAVCRVFDITLSEFFSTTEKEMLTAQEADLIGLFHRMNSKQRSLILAFCRELLSPDEKKKQSAEEL